MMMNVPLVIMTVMKMPSVPILQDPSPAHVNQATLVMARAVQVGNFSEIHIFVTLQVLLPLDF